jgi:hypothetical protein
MRIIVACGLMIAAMLTYGVPQTGAAAMGMDVKADVKKELATAFYHASELAQRGDAVAASKLHVQHVINCLEGPNGKNFKAAAGAPCQGQGNGAIPDLKDAVAAKVPGAEEALKQATLAWNVALQAIDMNNVNEVQPYAKVVARYLKTAVDALGS